MQYRVKNTWLIWVTVLISLGVQVVAWSPGYVAFQPNFVLITALFWAMATPQQFNIGSAFVVGLLLDLIAGVFGVRALAFSIVIYLAIVFFRGKSTYYHSVIGLQVVIVVALSILYQLIISGAEYFFFPVVQFGLKQFFFVVTHVIVYPLFFVIFRWLQIHFMIR